MRTLKILLGLAVFIIVHSAMAADTLTGTYVVKAAELHVKTLSKDKLLFRLNSSNGPVCEVGTEGGAEAKLQDGTFVYRDADMPLCVIKFKFSNNKVIVETTDECRENACGAGGNFTNGEYKKNNNKPVL